MRTSPSPSRVGTWVDLVQQLDALDDADKNAFLMQGMASALQRVGELRAEAHDSDHPRNVLMYASGWLQKAGASGAKVSITPEDLNGFMATIHGMDWPAHLTIILHTPGGSPAAAQTIVSYLRTKFEDIEVIVPTYAMSAGSMISLSANRIVMGRQSQLGPIDPQITLAGGPTMSARAIVEQFEKARHDIVGNNEEPGTPAAAALWGPILTGLGPSLLTESNNALKFGEEMVRDWLSEYMLQGDKAKAESIASHFNDASSHKSHSRRIDREEARSIGVVIEDMEEPQALQEEILTAYHLATILFEKSMITKLIMTSHDKSWFKQSALTPGPESNSPDKGADRPSRPKHQGRTTSKKKGAKKKKT